MIDSKLSMIYIDIFKFEICILKHENRLDLYFIIRFSETEVSKKICTPVIEFIIFQIIFSIFSISHARVYSVQTTCTFCSYVGEGTL